MLDTGVFIALINPGVSLVFAAAFLLLWHHQRHRRYILVLAGAFVAVAFAFALQYFSVFSVDASKLLSNLLFLAGGLCMAAGALGRYGRLLPFATIAVITAMGFSFFTWFLYVSPDLSWRIYTINFTFGAITLMLASEIRSVRGRALIDNVLLGVLAFWGITYLVRPIAVIWLDGPYVDYENFHQSLYWITLTSSSALFLVLFALTLTTAVALDVVEELKRESQTDALSALLNRRGFEEGAAEALRSAQRNHLPTTLVVCDLDHFKAINDTWGHGGGDAVIAAFAGCLRDCTGPEQVVGRIGGEEFAVLLKGANASTGRLFAEGARAVFAAASVPGLPEDARRTASFGVAEWRSGETVAELFARADAALYEAKNSGRDCVRVAPAPAPAARPAHAHSGETGPR